VPAEQLAIIFGTESETRVQMDGSSVSESDAGRFGGSDHQTNFVSGCGTGSICRADTRATHISART
jgi:hypothetical protein